MKVKFNIPAALIVLLLLSGASTVISVATIFVQWTLTWFRQGPPAWTLQWFGVSVTIQFILIGAFTIGFMVELYKETRK